jgi:hypothetical protein
MEPRVVAAGRGWQWIIEGFALFRKRAPVWIALTALLALLWAASLMLPVLGSLLFNLLSPALFAGLMIGCRALERGEDLKIMHLFAGFREQAGALVTLGGVYLVGTILVFGLVLLNADVAQLTAVLSKPGADIETLRAATRGLAFALLVGATAYMPLLMLLWFAPLLVVFGRLAPLPAMKLSLAACFKNMLPFLVYGAAVLALWLAISLPAAFGAVGAVLAVTLLVASVPVLFCSIYASYQDIFR